MKLVLYLSAVFSLYLVSFKETEVSAQSILPYYGGGISYAEDKDDDIGLLLTVLLLAARNRGNCGCCNCCNCPSNNIPIPYPIPFPTNNPIINRYSDDDDDKNASDKDDKEEIINIVTNNDEDVVSEAAASDDTKNTSNNNAVSSSGAAAS